MSNRIIFMLALTGLVLLALVGATVQLARGKRPALLPA